MCFFLHRHEGWLEVDAYYTGANRGVDPSDLAAGAPKPNEALILPNDSAADLTSPQGSGRAAKSGAADDSVTRSASSGLLLSPNMPPTLLLCIWHGGQLARLKCTLLIRQLTKQRN